VKHHITIETYDSGGQKLPDRLLPGVIDPEPTIDPVLYIRRLPLGSASRLVNALAFITNEVADFRRLHRGDPRVVSIAAADLRKAADKFEAPNKRDVAPSNEKRGHRRRTRRK
jgi:hypothetical protein